MALTLVATAGASNANSFATVAEGDAHHEAHLYASVWNAATNEQKAQALVWATRLIVARMEWDGSRTSTTQALPVPRTGLEEDGECVSRSIVPDSVKAATCELARSLLTTDPAPAASAGIAAGTIQELKVGPIGITYATGDDAVSAAPDVIPDEVALLLAPFGSIRGRGIASQMARV